jgi:hypothetical protein
MNKIILLLCMAVSTCNAADKVTIVSCYSSMTSKHQRHEITLSNGNFITIQTSLQNATDIKVNVSQKKLPIPVHK